MITYSYLALSTLSNMHNQHIVHITFDLMHVSMYHVWSYKMLKTNKTTAYLLYKPVNQTYSK